ncbi:protein kinase domain-containing protein [Archangium sp.]|jgi:serine/threonine-protein kinase|uniref:protein kinase domain-containing protein n=1 Tax=Archangium sp. TaxID=1872627 RepID=UPI002ED83DEF
MSQLRYQPLGPLVPGEGSRPFLALALEDGAPPRPVVLVWAPLEVTQDPTLTARLQKETARASIFEHPNILRVHGLMTLEGRLARVTEYADGEPLRQVLEAGQRLPPPFAALVVADVATGVHYAHVAGSDDGIPLVHGDLRPETVMVAFSGVCKVSGYGALSVAPRERNILRKRNQRLYSAPEQLMGGRAASSALTDVFLLGLLLYECLSGRKPFQDSLEPDKAILNRPLPPLSAEIPPALNDVVRRATEKRADQRYPSALAFRDALVAAIGELPGPAAFAELLGKLISPDTEARVARRKLLAKGLEDLARPPGPSVVLPSISTPAPVVRTEPVTNPSRVAQPAPITQPAPTLRAEPVTNPSRIVQPAPITQPAPTLRAEPITQPARILQAITQPSPVIQAAPITEPAPVIQAAPVTESAPVIQAAPVTPPSPVIPSETITERAPVIPVAEAGGRSRGKTKAKADPASALTVKVETLAASARPPQPTARPTALLATAIGALLLLSAVGAIWSTREKPKLTEPEQAAVAEAPHIAPSELLTAEPQASKDAGVSPPKVPAPTAPTVPPSLVEIFVSPDVDVSLEGRALGRTPLTIPLAPGHYTLTLTDPARGLVRTARMIDITHDGTSTFRIRLGMGSVLVHAPPGARISLDGHEKGTAPLSELTMFEGEHHLRVTLNDAVWEKTFALLGDQRLVFAAEFEQE